MPTRAQTRLALRVVIGTLWSAVLFIAGLRLATLDGVGLGDWTEQGAAGGLKAGGVAFAACGLFVFSCVVADRVFPRADGRICGAVQGLLVAVMVPCAGWFVWQVARLGLGIA